MDTYTIGEFSKKIGKSVITLQKWVRDGLLKASRTPTGRRFYTEKDFISLFSLETKKQSKRTYSCFCGYGQDRDFYDTLDIVLKAIVEEFKLVDKKALDLLQNKSKLCLEEARIKKVVLKEEFLHSSTF